MKSNRIIVGPLLSFVFLLFFISVIFCIETVSKNYFTSDKEMFLAAISPEIKQKEQSGPIVPPELNAKSAISVESNLQDINKNIFEKNTDDVLPIASLTKLMTAIIVLDNYNLADTITVDEIADKQNAIINDVKLNDKLTVENFLEITLIGSSNKSAFALSQKIGEEKFVELMNQKAKEIGLEKTFFADPTGLSPKNVSTATDLVKLAEYILKNYPKITDITSKKELDVQGFGKIENTDQLLTEIPEVVCSKTGYTNAAGGCLLLVINNSKNKDYFINVILGADDRLLEMKKLINLSSSTCN